MASKEDEDFIRRIAVEEITKRNEPILKRLNGFDSWMERLWNTNGGPPGYFQTRRDVDDERHAELADKQEKQGVILSEVGDFVKEEQARRKSRAERIAFWMPIIKWLGGIIGTALLGFSVWAYHQIAPVVKVLVDDYLHAHPMVMEKLKNSSETTDPALSSSHKPREFAGSEHP